jgi:hypothetical protein
MGRTKGVQRIRAGRAAPGPGGGDGRAGRRARGGGPRCKGGGGGALRRREAAPRPLAAGTGRRGGREGRAKRGWQGGGRWRVGGRQGRVEGVPCSVASAGRGTAGRATCRSAIRTHGRSMRGLGRGFGRSGGRRRCWGYNAAAGERKGNPAFGGGFIFLCPLGGPADGRLQGAEEGAGRSWPGTGAAGSLSAGPAARRGGRGDAGRRRLGCSCNTLHRGLIEMRVLRGLIEMRVLRGCKCTTAHAGRCWLALRRETGFSATEVWGQW